MPPTSVTAAGADRRHLTLDIPEPQISEEYEGGPFGAYYRVLVIDCSDGKWIVADQGLIVVHEDLTADDMSIVHPLCGAEFPSAGRPFLCIPTLTDAELADIRARGAAFARVMGVAMAAIVQTAVQGTKWLYSDPAVKEFSAELPAEILGHGDVVIKGSMALVPYFHADGAGDVTVAERLPDADFRQWLSEKRSGVGRDSRLAEGSTHSAPAADTSLPGPDAGRASNGQATPTGVPPSSPSAFGELMMAFLAGGSEPMAYSTKWEQQSGISASSLPCREHRYLMWAIWVFVCRDGYNGEHPQEIPISRGWMVTSCTDAIL